MIDIDDLSPRPKRTRSLTGVFDPNKFRFYAAFQIYLNYFRDSSLLVERTLDQSPLLEIAIPTWFATNDWNILLSNLDDANENLVKEFYANAIVEGEELKCWVRGKIFSVTPAYLAEILHINRRMFNTLPVYDDLQLDEDLLQDALGRNLEFSQNENSVSVSSLSPELRVLTILMFLHDLITNEDIDICAHIFHILRKTVVRTDSRAYILFCCLISRILKLKGISIGR